MSILYAPPKTRCNLKMLSLCKEINLQADDEANSHQDTYTVLYGPQREKTCLRGFGNNKGEGQPAHPRSLISTFVIYFLESIISKLATGEFSMF